MIDEIAKVPHTTLPTNPKSNTSAAFHLSHHLNASAAFERQWRKAKHKNELLCLSNETRKFITNNFPEHCRKVWEDREAIPGVRLGFFLLQLAIQEQFPLLKVLFTDVGAGCVAVDVLQAFYFYQEAESSQALRLVASEERNLLRSLWPEDDHEVRSKR